AVVDLADLRVGGDDDPGVAGGGLAGAAAAVLPDGAQQVRVVDRLPVGLPVGDAEPDVHERFVGGTPVSDLLDLDAPVLGDVEGGDALDLVAPRLLVLGDLPELQGDL